MRNEMGASAPFPTDEVVARLEVLLKKLDDEGWHVRANTVWLAIEEIKRLRK